jgi:hypothetical protein
MRALVIVLAVAAVTGCAAQRHWAKPGVTEADFHRDSYTCAQATSRDTFEWRRGGLGWGGGPHYGSTVDKHMYRACIKAQGYQFVEDGQWQGFRD